LAIEKVLANAFIDYQIKFVQNNAILPGGIVSEFCMPEFYESEMKSRVVDYITTLPKDSLERLELENEFLNWNITNILNNKKIWKALTGTDVESEINIELNRNTNVIERGPTANQDKTEGERKSLVPLGSLGQYPNGAVVIVYEKKRPDGTVVQKQKVKPLDEEGRFKAYFNKDQVTELYFLEGTKKLSFTKRGNSKGRFTHNKQVISKIGENCFKNCTSLQTLIFPEKCKKIGPNAFKYCKNLNTIIIGGEYVPLEGVFQDCRAISRIYAQQHVSEEKLRQAISGNFELVRIDANINDLPYMDYINSEIKRHTEVPIKKKEEPESVEDEMDETKKDDDDIIL